MLIVSLTLVIAATVKTILLTCSLVPRIRKNYYFSQCFCLVSFFRVSYAYMRKKMKEVVRYKFTAWFPFSQVCDIALVVSVPIQRIMRTRLKDWRTKR